MDATKLIGLMAAAATVTGCNGFNRVSYTRTMPFGEVLMVDANQRAILAGEAVEVETDDGVRLRQPTICSEPSPDSITAATLAASGSVEHEQVAAQASLALAQSASSIGIRTPSIQLLRDGMYRLCEAYQNGALGEAEYTRMLRQYQQMVVGLVAIEQLTGTVTAQQVALNSGGANASALQIQAALQDQRTLLQTWEQRRGWLRTRIQEIDTRNAARREEPEAERGATHEDTPNLDSYKSELAALDTNIAALQASIQRSLEASIATSRAQTNAGTAAFGAGGTTIRETRGADGETTTTTTTTTIAADTYNTQTAEVIAKAVRDITFEIIRTGEDGVTQPSTVQQARTLTETEASTTERPRRRSVIGRLFGRN